MLKIGCSLIRKLSEDLNVKMTETGLLILQIRLVIKKLFLTMSPLIQLYKLSKIDLKLNAYILMK